MKSGATATASKNGRYSQNRTQAGLSDVGRTIAARTDRTPLLDLESANEGTTGSKENCINDATGDAPSETTTGGTHRADVMLPPGGTYIGGTLRAKIMPPMV